MKRIRDKNRVEAFSPHQIHGEVPWVVIQHDRDEDLSTIHGGSRCAESPRPDLENDWNKLYDGGVDQDEMDGKSKGPRGGDSKECFYLILIAASIITLTTSVVLVVVYI